MNYPHRLRCSENRSGVNSALRVWRGGMSREISLFEFDEEEAEAAKARLDAQRLKRRKRYARKKDKISPSDS